MKSTLSNKLSVTLMACMVAGLSTSAMAATNWEKHHPRRDQVNDRLQNQNRRIHHEVKEGDLSKSQAAQFHKDDRQIRQEERDMASQNGGHITRAEQRRSTSRKTSLAARSAIESRSALYPY